jgi:hypothetical protein
MADDPRVVRIAELDAELSRLRPEYDRVKANLGGEGFQRRLVEGWNELHVLMAFFNPGDSGEKALFMLGRIAGLVQSIDGDLNIVRGYEALRERRRKLEVSQPAPPETA